MAKWFGAHYNQEVRFSSAVKCKKRPQVLTSLLNQRRLLLLYLSIQVVRVFLLIRLVQLLQGSPWAQCCLSRLLNQGNRGDLPGRGYLQVLWLQPLPKNQDKNKSNEKRAQTFFTQGKADEEMVKRSSENSSRHGVRTTATRLTVKSISDDRPSILFLQQKKSRRYMHLPENAQLCGQVLDLGCVLLLPAIVIATTSRCFCCR